MVLNPKQNEFPKSSGKNITRTSTYFLITYFVCISQLAESAEGLRGWQTSNMTAEAATLQAFPQEGTQDQAFHLVCKSQLMKSGIKSMHENSCILSWNSWNRLLEVDKWFSLPLGHASSLCYTPQLLDFPVNQSSSPVQQQAMQPPGEGERLANPDSRPL